MQLAYGGRPGVLCQKDPGGGVEAWHNNCAGPDPEGRSIAEGGSPVIYPGEGQGLIVLWRAAANVTGAMKRTGQRLWQYRCPG